MSIKFQKYLEIKDRCCLAYYGPSEECVVQLKILRSCIERAIPKLHIYLSCRDDYFHWINKEKNTFSFNELDSNRSSLSYLHEIKGNFKNNPIELFMIENQIPIYVSVPKKNLNKNCLMLNKDPKIEEMVKKENYSITYDGDLEDMGWVIGRGAKLFESARMGIKTTLISDGINDSLYLKIFPQGNIFKI